MMKNTNKKIELTPIEFSVVDGFIHYFVEPNKEKAEEFFRSKGRKYDADGNGLTMCDEGKDPIVWLKSRRPSVVAHEMIHAVSHLFSNLGITKVNQYNEELFAYFVDYAVSEILE